MRKYLEEFPYEVCLKVEDFYADDLRKIKRNEMGDLNWAVSISKWLCEITKTMKDDWIEENSDYTPNKEVEDPKKEKKNKRESQWP